MVFMCLIIPIYEANDELYTCRLLNHLPDWAWAITSLPKRVGFTALY